MEPANDVKLTRSFLIGFAGNRDALFDGPFVRFRVTHSAVEPAKGTIGYANICVIQMTIYVVVGQIAVDTLAYLIRELAHCQQVVTFKQRHSVFKGQPLSAYNLL